MASRLGPPDHHEIAQPYHYSFPGAEAFLYVRGHLDEARPRQVRSPPATERGTCAQNRGRRFGQWEITVHLESKQYSLGTCVKRTTHSSACFPDTDPDHQQRTVMLGVGAEKVGKEAVKIRVSI